MYRIGLAIAVGVGVMISGCGDPMDEASDAVGSAWSTPGCELARTPDRVTVSGVSMPVTPLALTGVMQQIEHGGRANFADSFAGVEVDQTRVRAIVFRVPSSDFDEFIRHRAGTECVVVRDALHSARDLAGWHDRVLADLAYWSYHGVRIVSVGALHDGTGVEIGVTVVDQARTALQARYGTQAPLIFAEQAPVRQAK